MVFDLWVPPKPAIIIPSEVKPLDLALIMAARLLMARSGGAAAPASTWNPADKAGIAALTVGNTVLNATSSATSAGARGTLSHAASTGLWYFEVTFATFAAPTGNSAAGLGLSSASLTVNSSTNTQTVSPYNTGWTIWPAGADIGPSPVAGDVLKVAWNSNTGDLYFAINGTYYDSGGSAAGSTPTTPSATGVSGTYFPIGWAYQGSSDNVTLNTQPASPPSGYTNWG